MNTMVDNSGFLNSTSLAQDIRKGIIERTKEGEQIKAKAQAYEDMVKGQELSAAKRRGSAEAVQELNNMFTAAINQNYNDPRNYAPKQSMWGTTGDYVATGVNNYLNSLFPPDTRGRELSRGMEAENIQNAITENPKITSAELEAVLNKQPQYRGQ